jgi:putative DNA primase/helicase
MATYTVAEQFLQAVFGSDYATYGFCVHSPDWGTRRQIANLDATRDCYWSVGAVPPGKARTTANALEVRALVIDDVGTKVRFKPLGAVLGNPTACVLTSAGNYQWVYRLSAPVAVAAWPAFFAGVEAMLGLGLDGGDAVHLFRVPLGVNTKPGRGGFAVRLTALNAGRELDVSKVNPIAVSSPARAAAAQKTSPASGLEPSWPVNLKLDELKRLMILIPNDLGIGRGEWIDIGHGLKALCGNDDDGFEVFDAWSQTWEGGGYDAGETRKAWDSFGTSGLRTKGGELRARAETLDPEGFKQWDAAAVFDDGEEPPPGDPFAARYDAAQVDMAEHIIGAEQGRLGWLHGEPKTWLGFDPVMHRWMRSGEDLLRGVVWEEIGRRRLAGVDMKTSRAMKSGAWHSTVTGLLVKHPRLRVAPELFDADKDVLGLPSGVLALDLFGRACIRAGRARDYIAKSTAVMPAARGVRSAIWEKFLDEFTCGDLELRTWLQVYMGYCLTGHTLHERVVFAYGGGGSGKGVFFRTCGAVMGDYATEAGQATFMQKGRGPAPHSTDLAVLEGLRMVVVPEVPDNAAWDMELIKRISGGDLIAARRMFQDQRTWLPQLKLIVVGNDQPEIAKVDDAVRRRLLTVWARYKAPVCDEQLKTRMRTTEGPAVLRWMVDGWEMWEAAGRKLPACKAIDDASKTYLTASDVFGRWKDECLERVEDMKERVRVQEIFDSWSTFKVSEGVLNVAPNASKNLMARLNEGEKTPFQTQQDRNGGRVVLGVRLRRSTAKTVF